MTSEADMQQASSVNPKQYQASLGLDSDLRAIHPARRPTAPVKNTAQHNPNSAVTNETRRLRACAQKEQQRALSKDMDANNVLVHESHAVDSLRIAVQSPRSPFSSPSEPPPCICLSARSIRMTQLMMVCPH